MEQKVLQGYLYDFYGELLNEHQREIFEASMFDDLSLAEIAEQQGISRQAVHDVIRRCNKLLEEYEAKLHLLEKFLHIKDDVAQIHLLTEGKGELQGDEAMLEIEKISGKILEEL